MVDESKIQEFIEYINSAESDVIAIAISVKNLCEQLQSVEQALRNQMANYEYEKNIHNKKGILDGMQTLADYYKSDLMSINENLDEYNAILFDIVLTKIKIPEYIDKRDDVLSDAEKFVTEFKLVYDLLIQNLETFINEPQISNVENLVNVINSEFDAQELISNIDENSQNMLNEFEEMCEKVEKLRIINKPKR